MPRRKPKVPAKDPYDAKIMAAFDRLRLDLPEHPDLQQKLREGRLKINIKNISIESGVSRGRVYKNKSILARVKEQKITKTGVTQADLVAQLREENAALREDVSRAVSETAAMRLRIIKIEETAIKEIRKAKRGDARKNSNQVGDNITQFPGGK